jgi:nitroimidazol reductase NimA-like FMN-containing flavoprotein (pyridoxamine 5'-phosphate oxidase superfamily)
MYAALDETLLCHVAVLRDGLPSVLPTTFVRIDDVVYLHGAVHNGLLACVVGKPCCFTATVIDGHVFAKRAAYHSMNYRSVVAYGVGEDITDIDARRRILDALLEKMQPGRSRIAIAANEAELVHVRVVALSLSEASCKMRHGAPKDPPSCSDAMVPSGVAAVRTVLGPILP